MGRLSRGWMLTKLSFQVISKDKELLLLPLLSGIISLLVLASFVLPWLWLNNFQVDEVMGNIITVVVMFAFYLVSYFVVIFFNTALVGAAMKRLEGGDPTVRYGLVFASTRLKAIFQWAIVAATVGLVLRAISSRSGALGQVIVALIGTAWTIATYFVVPVLAFEDLGPFPAIKRSLGLLRGTWGEALISNLGVGLIFFLLALVGFVPILLAVVIGSSTTIIIAVIAVVVYWIILSILSSAVSTVLLTALYRYASTGKVSEEFPAEVIANPWTVRQ